jgi:hypothetical protein
VISSIEFNETAQKFRVITIDEIDIREASHGVGKKDAITSTTVEGASASIATHRTSSDLSSMFKEPCVRRMVRLAHK